MGGKKPIGAAPSRGHHHNTAHSGHRVWSTPQFSYWGATSDSLWATNSNFPSGPIPSPSPPPPPPPDQSVEALEKKIVELSSELETVKDSLSSGYRDDGAFTTSFDQSISDRLLHYAERTPVEETEESREEDSPLNLIASRIGPFSTTSELWRRIETIETEVRELRQSSRRVQTLESTVRSLTARLDHLEENDRKKTNNPVSKPLVPTSEPFMPSAQSSEVRKLQDRVRTLEGRQGALQSKISAADAVLGRTGVSWQQSLKNMQDSIKSETSEAELVKRIKALEVSRSKMIKGDSSVIDKGLGAEEPSDHTSN